MPKTIEGGLQSHRRDGDQAGERTAFDDFAEKMRTTEIARLQKTLAQLIEGLSWVRQVRPPPWNRDQREMEQVVKIGEVEAKLFVLRQSRLL
jgi:hypothetical protein